LPVLPGLEVFHIHPGVDLIFDDTAIKLMNGFPVTVCVNKE